VELEGRDSWHLRHFCSGIFGIFWHFWAFLVIFWHFLAFCGIFGHFLAFLGILMPLALITIVYFSKFTDFAYKNSR
jgi:hypothetical protein